MLIYVMVKVNDSDHKICTDQIVKPTDHSQVPGVIELYSTIIIILQVVWCYTMRACSKGGGIVHFSEVA